MGPHHAARAAIAVGGEEIPDGTGQPDRVAPGPVVGRHRDRRDDRRRDGPPRGGGDPRLVTEAHDEGVDRRPGRTRVGDGGVQQVGFFHHNGRCGPGSMEASADGEVLKLAVSDRGPGFAPSMLAQFGKPYQSSKGRPGSGLGLFLVVNVIRTLGGTVEARNLEQGALVELRLPLSAIALE